MLSAFILMGEFKMDNIKMCTRCGGKTIYQKDYDMDYYLCLNCGKTTYPETKIFYIEDYKGLSKPKSPQ